MAGIGTAAVDWEKLAVVPALFPVKSQVPGVGSKPVMFAKPGPDMVMLLVLTALMVSPVASKL